MSIGRWVVGTADSVCRVSEGIDCAESISRRAVSGARDVIVGADQVHQIRAARQAAASSNAGLFHGDDDKEHALGLLDRWFADLRADVEPRASAIVTPAPMRQWWTVDVLPVLSDWGKFRLHQSTSWTNRMATEWSTYVAWLRQLRILRTEARAFGLVLATPEPEGLPETVFDRGASGRGSRLETAWTLGRVLVYSAIGIAGAASLWAIYREVSRPRDASIERGEHRGGSNA